MIVHPDPGLSAYFAKHEAVERLVQALALAEGYHLQIVLCNSQYVCRALIVEIEARVSSLRGESVSSRIWDLFEGLADESVQSGEHIERLLGELIQPHAEKAEALLSYVDGTAPRQVDASAWKRLFERLNQRRDVIARYVAAPLTLFLPEPVVGLLADSAPDLWSSRSVQVAIAPPVRAPSPAEAFRTMPLIGESRSIGSQRASSADRSFDASTLDESRRAAKQSPGDAQALHQLVILLERAAEQSAESGQLEPAVALLEEAVTAARKRVALAASGVAEGAEGLRTSPQASDPLPELAMTLDRLGFALSELGRHEEALEATREATETRRQLAHARPNAFLPDLSGSLINLGNQLRLLGQKEAALDACREAVEKCRQLAKATPDAYLSHLAAALNNLALSLGALGQKEAALGASREAAEMYRQLSKARPDAFLPNLAAGLNNLGLALRSLGRKEAALDASREAVENYRQLSNARRDAFLPYLAASLNNLGLQLGQLGQKEAALDASREAVEILRPVAKARPDAVLPDLAEALVNLGSRFGELGRREAALDASREALETYISFLRRQAAAVPAVAGDLERALDQLRRLLEECHIDASQEPLVLVASAILKARNESLEGRECAPGAPPEAEDAFQE